MAAPLRAWLHRRLRPRRYQVWERLCQQERLSAEALAAHQQAELARLLAFARQHTDFYADKYARIAADAPLRAYPVLRKSEVREQARAMLDRRLDPARLKQAHTGGSTGQPLAYYYTDEKTEIMRAGMMRSYQWSGWRPGERIVNFWGAAKDISGQPNWRARLRHWAAAELTLPAYHYGEAELAHWVTCISSYRPVLLQGYASVLANLAAFLLATGQRLPPLKGVYSTAEVLYAEQRQRMQQAFECKVFNQYGCREVPNIAVECPHGSLHVLSDRVVLESIEEQGVHKLLVTSLSDYHMPFIRYELGDLGRLGEPDCDCGRPFPTMSMIVCRSNDLIRTASGKVFYPAYFIHLLDGARDIQSYQFIQHSPHELELKVVCQAPLPDEWIHQLRQRIASEVDARMHLRVETVDHIPKTGAGKHRFVINQVDGC